MEANTSQRKWWIVCQCNGEGCDKCNGSGREYPDRCPVHHYSNELNTLRYLYANYRYKNILPFSGSPIEQPKMLMDTFNMIDRYLYIRDEIQRKERDLTRDVASKLMRGKNG